MKKVKILKVFGGSKMKFIKTLLSIFLFVSFISCGSEDSLENCKEPKKVVHVEDATSDTIEDKCMIPSDCKGTLSENNGTYTCIVKNDTTKGFYCNLDDGNLYETNGELHRTCEIGCEPKTEYGSASCKNKIEF